MYGRSRRCAAGRKSEGQKKMQTGPGLWRQTLWRQTPPAIFPPILGLFGLGLGWRRAAGAFSVPPALGELLLGAVSLLFVFALVAYLSKVLRRPGTLVEDLSILPGRAGVSTATMAMMLFSAALAPYSQSLAGAVLIAALAGHGLVIAIVLAVLARGPAEQRRASPVWHLTFVGPIVAPVAGAALGWSALSQAILAVSIPVAGFIWGASLVQLARGLRVPPPLRPTLAIHLSPAALLGIVSALLGHGDLALWFGWLSIAILAMLLLRARALTAAGFSPFWGAFTFPLAAFANLMLLLGGSHGGPYRVLGGLALVAASIVIPIIAFKVLRMWSAGPLAAKTNAARV